VLAGLTKRFVEDPVRRTRRLAAASWPAFVFAIAGSVLLAGVAWSSGQVVSTQRAAHATAIERELDEQTPCLGATAMLDLANCDDALVFGSDIDPGFAATDLDPHWCLTLPGEEGRTCAYGDATARGHTIALVGDSHGAALAPAFDEYYADRGRRVETYLRYGCPGLTTAVLQLPSQTPADRAECAGWSQRVLDHLLDDPQIETVVFTSFASSYSRADTPPEGRLTADEVEGTLARLVSAGKNVVVIRDVPTTGGVVIPTCLAQTTVRVAPCASDRVAATPRDMLLEGATRLGDDVSIVDLDDAMCDASRCYAVIGGVVVYADQNHLTRTFVRSMAPYLGGLVDGAIERQAHRS
jgi:hypothetical protein